MPVQTPGKRADLRESLDRDRSHLPNEAVEHDLELDEYRAKLMAKGPRAAKEGKFMATASAGCGVVLGVVSEVGYRYGVKEEGPSVPVKGTRDTNDVLRSG